MRLYKFFTFILFVIFISCSAPQQVARFNVTNLKYIDSISSNYFIYPLPQTTLRVEFEITKTEEIPGPYGEYAEILLGLNDIIDHYNVYYSISDVIVTPYLEPDPEEYYVVQFDTNYFHNNFHFSDLGFLVAVNDTNSFLDYDQFPESISAFVPVTIPEFGKTDRFVKRNIASKTEKRYKTVTTDSSTYKVPYTQTSYEPKSIKINAEEAANFIIKLRKRKFKLMAGLYENAPDGEAVPQMIKDLEELEQNYIALFTGEVKHSKYYYSFDYTPDPNNAIKTYTLCYFSESKGMLTMQELSSSPNLDKGMNIRPINMNIDAGLSFQSNLNEVSESLIGNSIVYKLPVYTIISLSKGNDIFFSKKIQIVQFGKKLYLPVYQSRSQRIIFNPQTGGLKSIQMK